MVLTGCWVVGVWVGGMMSGGIASREAVVLFGERDWSPAVCGSFAKLGWTRHSERTM